MSHIWVPKIKIIENTKEALSPGKVGVGGAFQIVGRLDDGRSRIIADWQPNLITNGGLDRMGQGTHIVNCSVGDSAVEPLFTDTSLGHFLAQQSSIPTESRGCASSSPYYGYYAATFRFNPPGTPRTLREVGFGWGTNGSSLFSHALIKDSSVPPNPIDVSWLAAETLDVSYQARMYLPLVDQAFTTTIGGAVKTGIVRAAHATDPGTTSFSATQAITINNYANPAYGGQYNQFSNGGLGSITGSITGSVVQSYNQNYASLPSYVAGSYKRTGTYVIGPATGNNITGGISAVNLITGVCSYQFSISPAIAKIADFTLTLNLETPTWGRYT